MLIGELSPERVTTVSWRHGREATEGRDAEACRRAAAGAGPRPRALRRSRDRSALRRAPAHRASKRSPDQPHAALSLVAVRSWRWHAFILPGLFVWFRPRTSGARVLAGFRQRR